MEQIKKLLILIISAAMMLSFYSCARKVSFLNSSKIPAAKGTVKVTKSNNNNYNLKIELTHIAGPGRLQPSKEAYVVWMKTDDGMTKNLGQIKSKSGLFSGNLKASLETVSPFYPVKIIITAEDEPDVQYPQGEVVLSTDNF